MEHTTKKIISMKMINKLQTNNISNNMEYVGFSAALEEIKDLNLDVVEIATDCHSQITSKLSKLLALYFLSREGGVEEERRKDQGV